MTVSKVNETNIKMCEALGIDSDNVHQLTIDLTAGNVGTVTVVRYLTDEHGQRLAETIKQVYKLEPVE